MIYTHAIVKTNHVEDENDLAPRVTVFTFPSADSAHVFRANNACLRDLRIYEAGHPNVPGFGENGVQYEPHDGAGVYVTEFEANIN